VKVTSHPILRRFWYPVLPMTRLESAPQAVRLLGEDIVVWKDGSGRPAAVTDRCCHRSAKLALGFYDEGRLACGYHGWCYDRTGRVVKIPQFPRDTIPEKARIKAFSCEERYGYAWVCLGEEPLAPIPTFPEMHEPGWRRIEQFHEVWNSSAMRVLENMMDTGHFTYVHKGTFGDTNPEPVAPVLEPFPMGYTMKTVVPVKNNSLNQKNLGMDSAETVRRNNINWWMPFTRRQRIDYPNGLTHIIHTLIAPIDDSSVVLSQFVLRNDTEADARAADIIAFDRQVTLEDKYFVEACTPEVPLADLTQERHIPSDKAGLMIRRMFRELFEAHGEPVHA
jgi:phenylpropionate dioxygenase-like ring-hydroxylating dioxygenase large terminal subunit